MGGGSEKENDTRMIIMGGGSEKENDTRMISDNHGRGF